MKTAKLDPQRDYTIKDLVMSFNQFHECLDDHKGKTAEQHKALKDTVEQTKEVVDGYQHAIEDAKKTFRKYLGVALAAIVTAAATLGTQNYLNGQHSATKEDVQAAHIATKYSIEDAQKDNQIILQRLDKLAEASEERRAK